MNYKFKSEDGTFQLAFGSIDTFFGGLEAMIGSPVLLKASPEAEGKSVVVCGWVRTNRQQKKLCFISLNDGSCAQSLQLLIEKDVLSAAMWEASPKGRFVFLNPPKP